MAENTDGEIGDPLEATDFNNDTLYYSLSGAGAASFEINQNTGQLLTASNTLLDFERKRSYRFTVEVSDRADQHGDPDMVIDDRQNVTITVTNVNEAPKITGDAAPSVEEDSNSAVASYTGDDPERDTLTWTISGSGFWISDRGQLYFATPNSFGQATSHTVIITATDDGNLSDSLIVNVTVTDVEEEGTVTVTPPRGWKGTSFTADLTDGDGGINNVTWTWERSSNRSRWTDIVGGSTGSYEATDEDIGNYLRVTASYTDRRGSNKTASVELTAQVRDVADRPSTNNPPEFADTPPVTRSIGQGTAAGRSIGAPVRATDPDSDDVLTYALQLGQDADKFDIDPATGQLRTKAALDYDPQGQNTYTVGVEVHDSFGPTYSPSTSVDAMITVTITVTAGRPPPPPPITGGGGGGGGGAPANRAPEFMEGDRTTRSVAENTPAGAEIGDPVAATDFNRDTLTYSLRGLGSDLFDVDASSGQLLTKAALDYETEGSYSVFVWVQDNKNAIGRPDTERDTVIRIELAVTNEDELGTVALSLSEPDVDVPITASLTDPDGGLDRVVWSWARSADQTAWTAISGAALASYTPVAADKGRYLRATASYTDGHGPRKSAQAATVAPVPSNAAPEFTAKDLDSSRGPNGAIERSVAENTGEAEAVGAPVAAIDAEGDAVTYALGGADAALFTIDPDTGQIRVGAGTTLDYEADKNVYEVIVTATDSSGASTTVAVTIAVTNVGLRSPLGDAYDADGNEAIDRDEAIAALADYFSGVMTREEAIAVLQLFFAR